MFKKINETLYKLHLDKIIFSYIRCYIAGILKLSESFKDHVQYYFKLQLSLIKCQYWGRVLDKLKYIKMKW